MIRKQSKDITPDEEAASWVVRGASDQSTQEDRDGLAAWIGQAPPNAIRYADHDALWQAVGNLADDDEARALLRSATDIPQDRWSRRGLLLASGVAAMAAAGAGLMFLPSLQGETLLTHVGEQRRLTLADGSVLMLNTDTKLHVRITDRERRITLDRGQAFFQVAKDAHRPFRVFVGDEEVRALGTAFEVKRDGENMRVVLEEGRVALFRGTRDQPATILVSSTLQSTTIQPLAILRPGEQATLTSTKPAAVTPADLAQTQAWRYGRLVLDAAPLGATIDDLNRYGGKQIRLADPSLAELKVSGVFHIDEPDRFVEGVTAALPLRVASDDRSSVTLDHK